MARPGHDVRRARLEALKGRVELARDLGVDDRTILRVERSIAAMPSTADADALLVAITVPSTEAQDFITGLIRRRTGRNIP